MWCIKGRPLDKRTTKLAKFLTKVRYEAKPRLSQEEIAKRIGKDKSFICRLERSTKNPPAHIIRQAAIAYDVPQKELLALAGYQEFPWLEVLTKPDDTPDSVLDGLTSQEKRELKRYLAYINIVNTKY